MIILLGTWLIGVTTTAIVLMLLFVFDKDDPTIIEEFGIEKTALIITISCMFWPVCWLWAILSYALAMVEKLK